MTRSPTLALLLLSAAGPAAALTPGELWSTWQAQAAALGATIDAEAVPEAGGALVLRGFTLTLTGGAPEAMPPESPVQEVTLTPTGDGGVAIGLGLPEGATVPIDAATGALRIEQRGLAIVARDGEAGAPPSYEASAERLTLALVPPEPGSVPTDFEQPYRATGDFALELAAPAIRVGGGMGAGQTLSVGLAAEGVAYIFESGDLASGFGSRQASRSEGASSVDLSLTMPAGQGLIELGTALGAMSEEESGLAILRAVEDGLGLRADYANEVSTQSTWVEGFPFSYQYESRLEPGTASVVVDRAGVAILSASEGGSVAVTSPDLPVPSIDLSFGPFDVEVRVPLDPGPWRYRVALSDVVVNEAVWAFVDPEGRLPRDPARLLVDLGGESAVDLGAMMASGAATPSGGVTIDVAEASLAVAGLLAEVTGRFALDDIDAGEVPVGRATARVEGLDRLIDAGVALGWITPGDARDARLGLATVFRAGEGPDVRVTEVETRANGGVFVNGVQVQ